MTKFHDLTFNRQTDGSIRLTQSDCGEDSIIDLHPVQLRHIAEAFGVVAPSNPADELSKRLAFQLCTILRELEDECHRSHWLQLTYTKLDAWCSALPDDIFPHHVWDDDQEAAPEAQKTPVTNAKASNKAKSPITPAIASSEDAQLGLAV